MNRKNAIRLAVGGGAILVVGLATYFGIKLATQPEKQNGGGGGNNGGVRPPSEDESVPQTGTQQGKIGFPLVISDRGLGVAYLQKDLQCLDKYNGIIDGKFGVETYKAVGNYFPIKWVGCRLDISIGSYKCKVSESDWKEIVKEAKAKCGLAVFSVADEVWEEYTPEHINYWNAKRQER